MGSEGSKGDHHKPEGSVSRPEPPPSEPSNNVPSGVPEGGHSDCHLQPKTTTFTLPNLSLEAQDRRPELSSRPVSSQTPATPPQPLVGLRYYIRPESLECLYPENIALNHERLHDLHFHPGYPIHPELVHPNEFKARQRHGFWFWKEFEMECGRSMYDPKKFRANDSWYLPVLLRDTKALVLELVPSKDKKEMDLVLDTRLMVQELSGGNLTLGLTSRVFDVLAEGYPHQKEQLDHVAHKMGEGHSLQSLTSGLRELLSLLEVIFLDRATSFIHHVRRDIDLVNVERIFFGKMIINGHLNIRSAKLWYRGLSTVSWSPGFDEFGLMCALSEGLARLVLPSSEEDFPVTFCMDLKRLLEVQDKALVVIVVDVCVRLYECATPAQENSSHLRDVDDPCSPGLSPAETSGRLAPEPHGTKHDFENLYRELFDLKIALRISNVTSLAEDITRMATVVFNALGSATCGRAFEKKFLEMKSRGSDPFQEAEKQFLEWLLKELRAKVKECKAMSAGKLYETLTPGKLDQPSEADCRSLKRVREDTKNDIVRSLTHVIILHARTWGGVI